MTPVHLVLPAGYDDPYRPSGGNIYAQHLSAGLTDFGWSVTSHEIPDAWPKPRAAIARAVDRELARIPADRVVVVDGLVASATPAVLLQHAPRLRLVALVHMPGEPGGPPVEVLRAARLVVTTSEWTARVLLARHGLPADRLLVAHPGAARAAPATGTATGRNLLCVAAVVEQKGHDVLFEALAALRARSWTCVCVGALDREPRFVRRQRRTLAANGIADRVRFTGPLVGADLGRAYAASDVLVLPTRLESYGMVVTEALARGVPVISTSVGGVPEALGQALDGSTPGILVPPHDDQALGAAVAGWLDRPQVRAQLRSSAHRRRATLSTWDDTVRTIASALSEIAAHHYSVSAVPAMTR